MRSFYVWFVMIFSLFATSPAHAAGSPIGKAEKASPLYLSMTKGETIWHIADKYCGNPFLYPKILEDNGMTIADARHIPVGTNIAVLYALPVLPTPAIKTPAPKTSYVFANVRPLPLNIDPSGVPIEAPILMSEPLPEPTPIQPVVMQPVKPAMQKVTGYAIGVFGESAQGIPLHRRLNTCVILFDARKQNCKYKAWAEQAKNGVVLKVSLKELPSQRFALVVDGMHNRIDGAQFTANATPFEGRLPGPRGFVVVLKRVGESAGRGALAGAMTGNPFIGVGVAAAPFAIDGIKALVQSFKQ